MLELLKFEIFAPLSIALVEKEMTTYFQEGVQELLEIDCFVIDLPETGQISCAISVTNDYVSQLDKNFCKSQALTFKIEVPAKEAEATIYYGDEETKTYSIENYISLVAGEFKLQLTNFLLFLQIAKPGALRTREGYLLVNNEYYESYDSIISIHQEIYSEIKRLGWPKFRNLKYQEVINWYKQFNLSFDKIANTKAEIALNAFSYLFEYRSDTTLDLFWSLIGIEALFCSGKEGKAEQIFEKTQVVLGPIKDFKKRVKDMYNFRSRLIHGDLFIPSAISKNFSLKDIEGYNDNFYDATIISVAILTATLQELVYLGKDNLSFKTILI